MRSTSALAKARDKARENRLHAFRQTTTPQDPQNRLVALFIVFVLISAGLVAVLVDIQTVRNDFLRDYGESQRSRTRQLDGYRGQILDRNGSVLATSTPSNNLIADPEVIQDPQATAELLAPHLDLSTSEIVDKLAPDKKGVRYVRLQRNVDDSVADKIGEMRVAEKAMLGIFIESEEARLYPTGDVARQIVGRVDPEENGVSGIEQQYDKIMDGESGSERFEGGRFGRISVGESVLDPATDGFDVTLTLDHRLQFMAEQTLIAHCQKTGAKSATAVISDPNTGEILTMASVDRNDDDRCEVAGYNTALVDTFEPGSVLKPVTMAAAVQTLGYTGETPVEVPPSIRIANKNFIDHPAHPAAMFPLSQILSDSMNVGTIKVAQEVGVEGVHGYLDDFGFGQSTGLGFQGESIGTLRQPEDWQGSDAGSIPIGQGVTVNATQLVAAYNVFANRGVYQQPLLISSLRNADGQYFTPDPRATKTVISPEAADEVVGMLEKVVSDGTGKKAAIPGYTVAGKTGTAWKVFENEEGKRSYGVPGDRRYVVTFAGLAPASNPKISMAVVVNEPRDVAYVTAGAVAAPLFAEIGEDALRILGAAPDLPSAVGPGLVRGSPAQLPVPPPVAPPEPTPAAPAPDSTTTPESTTSETTGQPSKPGEAAEQFDEQPEEAESVEPTNEGASP